MPPVPGGPLVGVPPMLTPGVVPGTGELLGLASFPRMIGLGPRSLAPSPAPPVAAGGATLVFPAPPVTTCAAAGSEKAKDRAPASAMRVRVMCHLCGCCRTGTAGAEQSSGSRASITHAPPARQPPLLNPRCRTGPPGPPQWASSLLRAQHHNYRLRRPAC